MSLCSIVISDSRVLLSRRSPCFWWARFALVRRRFELSSSRFRISRFCALMSALFCRRRWRRSEEVGPHGREIESLRDFEDKVVDGLVFDVLVVGDEDHTNV